YNLAEAGAEAGRLAGATRDQIAAAAAAAIAGTCSPHDARVIVALVTTSAMLRRSSGDDGDVAGPAPSKSSRFAAALQRARGRLSPRPEAPAVAPAQVAARTHEVDSAPPMRGCTSDIRLDA